MVDKRFVQRKLGLIQQDLEKLTILKGLTFEEIAKDFFKYSTLKLVLMEIIGRAIDINEHLITEQESADIKMPLTYRETFLILGESSILPEKFAQEIAKSTGFRNAIVHDYNNLDKYVIYTTIDEAIQQYTKYCEHILIFLSSF